MEPRGRTAQSARATPGRSKDDILTPLTVLEGSFDGAGVSFERLSGGAADSIGHAHPAEALPPAIKGLLTDFMLPADALDGICTSFGFL
jgi:hypothetical protein